MKIVIEKNRRFKKPWTFRFVAKNGEFLMYAWQRYFNLDDMLDTINLIKVGITDCEVENKYLNVKP